ncbi:MAG TPA: hypothetical protein VKF40_13655 [Burkholderiales bacterium]|nr:hypothetical protein [Burkholderiales bacterium]
MKSWIAAALGIVFLAGCVAVPVYDAAPAPGYYYGAPPVSFSFGYSYRGGYGYRHWR